MPVLVKSENMPPRAEIDLDKLVFDLRERLCLKNSDRNYPRRSSPYQNRRHVNYHNETCSSSSLLNSTHQKEYLHKCHRRSKVSKIKFGVPEDPRALLDKLIRDQSLIQEAVKRVQFQFSQSDVNVPSKSAISPDLHGDGYISSSDNDDSTNDIYYSRSSNVSHSIDDQRSL